jgi:DNA-binding NtrC family response regulator
MAKILIVEDDAVLSELLAMHLEEIGHVAVRAESLSAARLCLRAGGADAVLLDFHLPDGKGFELLEEIRSEMEVPVIMITGGSDTTLAIESLKRGAYDFVRKPMDEAELDATLGNALAVRRLSGQVEALQGSAQAVCLEQLVGRSRAMLEVCKTIGMVAGTDATVLITGESGTGKEVVARALHHHSGRAGSFLPINCSALVETLLESELFGHERGSFTGAQAQKRGKFELAAQGTLFLDEAGEMSPGLQAKLLRVLQERAFERVGGTQVLSTDARVIAATNRDLAAMVRDGRFREDLYYRLNVVTIHLPPLRERMDDLPLLVEHLLRKINRELHKRVTRVAPQTWVGLHGYTWPGNVRELENVLTRAVVLARGEVLTPELLDLHTTSPGGADRATPGVRTPELASLKVLEERHVRAVLAYTRWHKGRACEILGISRPALERKIQKYDIAPSFERGSVGGQP